MGSTVSKYRGYGKTHKKAVHSLGAMLKFHHGNVTVHQESTSGKYYAFDGRKHYIGFDKSKGSIRAFLVD